MLNQWMVNGGGAAINPGSNRAPNTLTRRKEMGRKDEISHGKRSTFLNINELYFWRK
jgi:hypothetical protein